MRKLAFLFLIYDGINQERLWHKFFANASKDKYSVYIHYKNSEPLTYFEACKIAETVPTSYADLSLVKAQNALLRAALKDIENERFIFVSNSCIPLKAFDYIYDALFENDRCLFNMAREEHVFERGRGLEISRRFGRENVKKASQWCALTREIADVLAKSDDVLESLFEPGKKDLADEYFYISYLHYLNKQNCIHGSYYETVNCMTFEYWDDKDYRFNEVFTSTHPAQWDRRLKTYNDISENELAFLVGAPCLFGRKFDVGCTVDGRYSLLEKLTMLQGGR